MSCYVEGCVNPVEWYIWVDGSLCCDKHAEEIGSYVTELEAIPEAIPEALPKGQLFVSLLFSNMSFTSQASVTQ